MASPIDLSIVIPAFNEADRIGQTVRAWSDEVRRLGISHEIVVYDDGSTDGTPIQLEEVAHERPEVRVSRHTNRGHGPTILTGYRHARGEWVLQVDGDDEVGCEPFERFWSNREQYDLLIGCRSGRRLGFARRVLTVGSRLAVRLAFGRGVSDVNAPYRLIRRSRLTQVTLSLPDDMFAPNVAITALAIAGRWRIKEETVRSRPEASRSASWSAVPVAWIALRQLLSVSRRRA